MTQPGTTVPPQPEFEPAIPPTIPAQEALAETDNGHKNTFMLQEAGEAAIRPFKFRASASSQLPDERRAGFGTSGRSYRLLGTTGFGRVLPQGRWQLRCPLTAISPLIPDSRKGSTTPTSSA